MLAQCQGDYVFAARALFGFEPDKWQARALRYLERDDIDRFRLALAACVGVGKSAFMAITGLLLLALHGEEGEHPMGVAMSMDRGNLRSGLWKEMHKWLARSEVLSDLFETTADRIRAKDHPDTWYIEAVSWPKKADVEEIGLNLSGKHARYIFFLVDEAGSKNVPPIVLQRCEQALGDPNCKRGVIIMSGNPFSRASALYHGYAKKGEWLESEVISITGDPDDPERSPRVDADKVARLIKDHGREEAWVMSHWLGQFPLTDINAIISEDEVKAATTRHLQHEEYEGWPVAIGVDVAFEGTDASVISIRKGKLLLPQIVMRGANGIQGAARVSQLANEHGADAIFVDGTGGFGSSWCDQLEVLGFNPVRVHFSSKADDPTCYLKRSEMIWRLSLWIKAGGSIPDCPELRQDLLAHTYYDRAGQLAISPKDIIKEILFRSPDWLDSAALTLAYPLPAKPSVDRFHAEFMRHGVAAEVDTGPSWSR